jgi:integrase
MDNEDRNTPGTNPFFEDALDQLLEFSKANTEASSYATTQHNAKPLRRFSQGKRLSQVDRLMIDSFRIDCMKVCECASKPKGRLCPTCGHHVKQLSDAVVNHELIILKQLFNKCTEWNMAETNPAKGVKLAKLNNERTRHLSPEEAERLLACCNPDFRDVVLLAMHSGCRSKEIKTLRWNNVDLQQRTITILSQHSKNKDVKIVPMSDDLYETFTRIKAERNRGPEDVVFLSRYGKPWKSWSTGWENACQRAGLSNLHFHDLRHCFASRLAMNGTAQKNLMQLLGHRDSKATERYTHFSDAYRRAAVANLPSFSEKSFGNDFEGGKGKVVRFHN